MTAADLKAMDYLAGHSSLISKFSKSKELERIHMKFCKRVLGVKLSTSNAGIYGELGRYPLYVARYTRIVKYWFKILYSDNIILRTIYDISVKDCENGLCNSQQLFYYIL